MKEFDDTDWKGDLLGIEFNQSKFASKLLKDGLKLYAINLSWLSLHQMEN